MTVAENLQRFRDSIPEQVTLVAVSKTKPLADILDACNSGHRDFGENRVDEFVEKCQQLPPDIRWHFIGHLQSKKVKKVVPFANLIHSVDSLKLLTEINKRAAAINKTQDCLLQIHIAQEESKYGFSFKEAEDLLISEELKILQNVRITGLMGMATYTDDMSQVRKEFRALANFYNQLPATKSKLQILSMGMTGDYRIAIEEGSNMVRIGSAIFGERG